jgi:hypothetical protein
VEVLRRGPLFSEEEDAKVNAAALALVGWYLMVPPAYRISKGLLRWDDSAPLSAWRVSPGFDTASQCKHTHASKYAEVTQTHRQNVIDFVKSFQCIATDDPRLPK